MDYYLHRENVELVQGKLEVYGISLLYIKEMTLLVLNVLNDITFVSLFIYNRRRKSQPSSYKSEFDTLIFNQMYYVSGCSLVFYDISFALRLVGEHKEDTLSESALVYMGVFAVFVCNFVYGSIIMFSFLAAVQRFVILYIPKYKWLVTGSNLSKLIIFAYMLSIFYCWLYGSLLGANSSPKWKDIAFLWFNFIFFTMTITSGLFYYHLYQLLKKLPSDVISETRILYRFVPIYSLQVVFILIALMQCVLGYYEYKELKNVLSAVSMVLPHFTPITILLSYTASMQPIRSVVISIVYPIFKESSV